MRSSFRGFVLALAVPVLGASSVLAADPPKPARVQMPAAPASPLVVVMRDPLTAAIRVAGEGEKRVKGGEFTPQGWKTTANGDQMMIEIAEADSFDGALEIDMVGLDWAKANTSHNQDKIAFLSMFSNPSGCPHVTHYGTNNDALWMLRTGRKPDNTPFFGQGFKVYWSERGASGAEPSNYSERIPSSMESNTWAGWKEGTNTVRVFWSKTRYRFGVMVNGEKVMEVPYEDQIEPFKYIFIGKAGEFDSLVGPTFTNLRLYGPPKGEVPTVEIPDALITVPGNGTVFELGAMIPIQVAPRITGREISRVEFFQGTERQGIKKIGEDTSRPFAMTWDPGRTPGRYVLTATAFDATGAKLATPPKYVIVSGGGTR